MLKKIVKVTIILVLLVGILSIYNQIIKKIELPIIGNGGVETKNFNKNQHPTDVDDSIWVIVNKKNPLNKNYQPTDLVDASKKILVINPKETKLRLSTFNELQKLLNAASREKIKLQMISGFRSFELQNLIYQSNIAKDGQEQADVTSARPGFSEHQTGLAVDISAENRKCMLKPCFGNTKEAKWLAENAPNFGFIVRYPKNKTAITGYEYEPWHIRYVGKELAKELSRNNQTMEEFFDYPKAPSYD